MYSSSVRQKSLQKQSEMSNQNLPLLTKGNGNTNTINKYSIQTTKQERIKQRDLSSPYSSSLIPNTQQKKKIQSLSVEKYNYKGNENVIKSKQWQKQLDNTIKNITQEEECIDLQTTAVSDLRGSQNLNQKHQNEYKRNSNCSTSYLSQSKQNQQQLGSSVEYSANHFNSSTTTTTTITSRGNYLLSKQMPHSQKKNISSNASNGFQSKSPKCYTSQNPNSTSVNPWNINQQIKPNLNCKEGLSDSQKLYHEKMYKNVQNYSPENNYKMSGNIRLIARKSAVTQKSVQKSTELPPINKRNRDIQSAKTDHSNINTVKETKFINSKQRIFDRTNLQNNATKLVQASVSSTNRCSSTQRNSGTVIRRQKKLSDHLQSQSNRYNANINTNQQYKSQKDHQSINDKEAFNKKLNQKIQQKTFEQSTNEINSASDTEYFEMSQKFSTIGDPRIFSIEHFMGNTSKPQNINPTPQIKNNIPKPGIKYLPNQHDQVYKIKQNYQNNKQNQLNEDDEIEEKIETESISNTPNQYKNKQNQNQEINEINQIEFNNQYDDQYNQVRITKDFKDSHKMSNILHQKPITINKSFLKKAEEGNEGDDEENSGDYTDNEMHKKINSTGIQFTKPNLTIRKSESYVSDLQLQTQDKIFQKQMNPSQSQNYQCQNQLTQEEYDINNSNLNKKHELDERQDEELNQSQTRFLKDQIFNIMMNNIRPFTPPFQQQYSLNSSKLRQQESISCNSSNHHQHGKQFDFNVNQQPNSKCSHFNNQQSSKNNSLIYQNKPSMLSSKGESQIEVLYDDILDCYYDPKTNQYYELKA